MHLQFTTLDVFTTTRYTGNPLAIVRIPVSIHGKLTEGQKQKIAREFNLSEITFIYEPTEEGDVVDVDIFTPVSRIPFAGHPTLGTAFYVAHHPVHYNNAEALRVRAGLIQFRYTEGRVTISIPHDFYIHHTRLQHPYSSPGGITASSATPIVSIVKGMAFGLACLSDLDTLALPTGGLIDPEDRYKAKHLDQGSGWDFGYTGSFYYVDLGDDPENKDVRLLRTRNIHKYEDPGTGSASAALSCFIALQQRKAGVNRESWDFHLVQGVEMGRRCDIFVSVRLKNDGKEIDNVTLSGSAVEVMEGTLVIE